MIKEFKKFISRGNVIDLAVGVIIGGAFGKIVTSLVNDIIMPLIGIVLGGINFSNLTLKIKDATINYGLFIQNIVDFFLISLCIFLMIKLINKIFSKEEKKEKVIKSDNIILLEEIRDILKGKK